ncbi:MAG: TIGR00266 family protein [Deltaproteobacteria bacterium]|jgi:uncharacterized protein (TIGR00266 family)|nr:TIGR00266 family protein [Deltaproteobacteria bacterium]
MNPPPKYEILHPGAFPMLLYRLDQGETFKAESGSMVVMDSHLEIDARIDGGILQGLARKVLASEKLFFQFISAPNGPGEACFSPVFPGGIVPVHMDGNSLLRIQKDGFLASTQGVTLETISQSLSRGLFSREGFFILRAAGQGTLFLSAYGAIHSLQVPPGRTVNVDNGHLVAWNDAMPYSIRKASRSLVASFTSGEGLVCSFTGPGTVYIQTRNPGNLTRHKV